MDKEKQYLNVIQSLINEEVLMIKYSPESKGRIISDKLINLEMESKSLEDLYLKLKDLYDSLHLTFFVLEDQDNDCIINEMYISRFYSAVSTYREFYLHYNILNKSDKFQTKLNECGYDSKINETLKINIDSFGIRLLTYIYNSKVIDIAKNWVEELERKITEIRKLEYTQLQWIELTNNLSEYLSNFIDEIDDAEIDIEDSEIDQTNAFFSTIVLYDGIFYNILILREKLIESEELRQNQIFLETKQLLNDRDERLEYMKRIADNFEN